MRSLLLAFFVGCSVAGLGSNPAEIERLASASSGLENIFALSSRLYSSGSPETEEAFRALRKLGIKTIISVDGAVPKIELARKYGIRYIHLPIGYNGTTSSNALRLVKAAQCSPGPVLVHCHHGKHRGPAAAALIARALEGWDAQAAVKWLQTAGTSKDYPGLFDQVRSFQPPVAAELDLVSTNFPERAVATGIVDAMVQIDHSWEQLHAAHRAGYGAPANHPDLVPAKEAALLAETFREFLRSDGRKQHGTDFVEKMEAAEKHAWDFHSYLKSNSLPLTPAQTKTADALWSRLSESCVSCHKQHRN